MNRRTLVTVEVSKADTVGDNWITVFTRCDRRVEFLTYSRVSRTQYGTRSGHQDFHTRDRDVVVVETLE